MANEKVDALGIPQFDTSKWTEEQVGFAPYWEPVKEQKIIAQLVQKDSPEESFVRYLMRAGQDIECFRGPAEEQEKVTVKKGEYFTFSVFHSLQGLFDFYLDTGHKPWMEIMAKDKVKTKTVGRTVWTWRVRVSPEDKKKADALRMEMAKTLAALPEKKEEQPELSS